MVVQDIQMNSSNTQTKFLTISRNQSKNIRMRRIFVLFFFRLFVGKAEDNYTTFPVIRSPEHGVTVQQSNNIFIGSVYKDRLDYLNSNTLLTA
jgi:hypothetical protein